TGACFGLRGLRGGLRGCRGLGRGGGGLGGPLGLGGLGWRGRRLLGRLRGGRGGGLGGARRRGLGFGLLDRGGRRGRRGPLGRGRHLVGGGDLGLLRGGAAGGLHEVFDRVGGAEIRQGRQILRLGELDPGPVGDELAPDQDDLVGGRDAL